MAKKLSRLQRSQNAHFRLRQKAADIPGLRGEILHTYHKTILDEQKQARRILTKKERQGVFRSLSKLLTPKKKSSHPHDDFTYTSNGRIKGSYTVDGFFEPD